MRAVGEYVTVVRDQKQQASGELFLLADHHALSCTGKVLSAGVHARAGGITAGDRVVFSRLAGTEALCGEETLLILHRNDILATIAL